jgi:hypothetical protein
MDPVTPGKEDVMSVTDELLANAQRYAAGFDKDSRRCRQPGRSPSWRAWTRG